MDHNKRIEELTAQIKKRLENPEEKKKYSKETCKLYNQLLLEVSNKKGEETFSKLKEQRRGLRTSNPDKYFEMVLNERRDVDKAFEEEGKHVWENTGGSKEDFERAINEYASTDLAYRAELDKDRHDIKHAAIDRHRKAHPAPEITPEILKAILQMNIDEFTKFKFPANAPQNPSREMLRERYLEDCVYEKYKVEPDAVHPKIGELIQADPEVKKLVDQFHQIVQEKLKAGQ